MRPVFRARRRIREFGPLRRPTGWTAVVVLLVCVGMIARGTLGASAAGDLMQHLHAATSTFSPCVEFGNPKRGRLRRLRSGLPLVRRWLLAVLRTPRANRPPWMRSARMLGGTARAPARSASTPTSTVDLEEESVANYAVVRPHPAAGGSGDRGRRRRRTHSRPRTLTKQRTRARRRRAAAALHWAALAGSASREPSGWPPSCGECVRRLVRRGWSGSRVGRAARSGAASST